MNQETAYARCVIGLLANRGLYVRKGLESKISPTHDANGHVLDSRLGLFFRQAGGASTNCEYEWNHVKN